MRHLCLIENKYFVPKRKVFKKFLTPKALNFIKKNTTKPIIDKKLFRRLTN